MWSLAKTLSEGWPDELHASHDTRISDASSFDEICTKCGRHDIAGGGWGLLRMPCPAEDWIHCIAVVVVDGDVEASNYVAVQLRVNMMGDFEMRGGPHSFKCFRRGAGRIAFMDGDFQKLLYMNLSFDILDGVTVNLARQ